MTSGHIQYNRLPKFVTARIAAEAMRKWLSLVERDSSLTFRGIAHLWDSTTGRWLLIFDQCVEAEQSMDCQERQTITWSLRLAHREPQKVWIAPPSNILGHLEMLLCVSAESKSLWAVLHLSSGEAIEVDLIGVPFGERFVTTERGNSIPVLPQIQRSLGNCHRNVVRWTELRVGVIGCGRLGSQFIEAAATQGIRRIVAIDPDFLEQSNLDGMSLVSEIDVLEERTKVRAIGRRLACDFPNTIEYRGLAEHFPSRSSLSQLLGVDVLVTSADTVESRLAAADVNHTWKMIHIDIGTQALTGGSYRGDVRMLLPGDGCVVCRGGVTTTSSRPGNSSRQINALVAHSAVEMLAKLLRSRNAKSQLLRFEVDKYGRISSSVGGQVAGDRCPICSSEGRVF